MNRLRTWFLAPAWMWLWVLFAAPFAIVVAYSLLTRGPYGGLTTPWTVEFLDLEKGRTVKLGAGIDEIPIL